MVKVSDCTCCDCDSAQEKEQIKERALSSINKIWTTDAKTYYPDGTGMVTLPIPSMEQIDQISINAEHIAANTADITALNAEMEDVQGTAGKIPTGYTLYRDGEGKIRLQAEATDGSLINSNVLDMIIPYQYDLISGTTDRSFKLNITMSDGSSYTTNDFVIPEGGGTDVTVTGIVLSKDQGDVNRFHVGINLSDSTMIDSGYISMVDNVAATYADGKLTISVNGVSSVPVAVDVTGEFSAGDGIKIESGTISISDELAERLTTIEGDIATLESDVTTLENDVTNVLTVANRAFDAVSLADNVLTLERGNGGTESVTLPSGGSGDEWEEIDLDNWPSDFLEGDILKVQTKTTAYGSTTQWTTVPSDISIPAQDESNYFYNEFIVTLNSDSNMVKKTQQTVISSVSISEIRYMTLHAHKVTDFNSSSSTRYIFYLEGYRSNGAGCITTTISIPIGKVKSYILAIYRKRAT